MTPWGSKASEKTRRRRPQSQTRLQPKGTGAERRTESIHRKHFCLQTELKFIELTSLLQPDASLKYYNLQAPKAMKYLVQVDHGSNS